MLQVTRGWTSGGPETLFRTYDQILRFIHVKENIVYKKESWINLDSI